MDQKENLISATAQIVAAYLSRNNLPVSDIPALVTLVHASLSDLPAENPYAADKGREPAVPVKSSVMADYIICLEDGKKMKMLKRYLKTAYGLTPEQYRKKWNLPPDYPMVAPNYAKKRSSLAKEHGLGRSDRE